MTESPRDLVHEAERGDSPRTPFLLWGGMHLLIGAVVAIIAAAMLILYFVLK
jgi:hypothetical protein